MDKENFWKAICRGEDVSVISDLGSLQQTDSTNCSVLMAACSCGHINLVKWLLDAKVNVGHKDKDDWTALMHAVVKNNYKFITPLPLSRDKLTLMHKAFVKSFIVTLLVNAGSDLDVRDKCKMTALMHACYGEKDHVTLLLEAGAKDKLQDNHGMTALMHAICLRDFNLTHMLLSPNTVNMKDNNDETTLMYAILHRNCDYVLLLLNAGADINATDGQGMTALFHATHKGDVEIVRLLLRKKANTMIRNSKNSNVLVYSISCVNLEITSLLLSHFEINGRDTYGRTPLFFAVIENKPKIVSLFLSKKAKVNITDNKGKTALMYARYNCNTEIVKLLEAAS